MAENINANIPSDCVSSNRCVKISFDVPISRVVSENSESALLSLNIDDLDGNIQLGTTVNINGTVFTFAAETDYCNNEIGFTESNVLNFIAIAGGVINSFDLSKCMTANINQGVLELRSLDCTKSISVSFDNTIEPVSPYFVAAKELEIKDYSICAVLSKEGTDCEDIIINIPSQISKSCDECDVESVVIEKDISGLLESFTPLPSCDVRIVPRLSVHDSMMCKYEISYTEQIGGQRFNRIVHPSLLSVLGANVDNIEEYCPTDASQVVKQLSLSQEANKVCLNQCNRTYLVLTEATNYQLLSSINIYNKQGALISGHQFISGFNGNGVVEVQNGIPNWYEYLVNQGFTDFDNIGSYTMVYRIEDSNGVTINYDPKTYIVECCVDGIEFVFLSSLGTYESIKLRNFSNRTTTIVKETITECLPCDYTVTDKNTSTRKSDAYQDLTYYTNCDFSSELFLCELIMSSDVYINIEGVLYYVELISTSLSDFQNNKNVSVPITVRLYKNKSLVQC